MLMYLLDRFGSTWRTFWHTMTSNDRHAAHDSPYKTGQHVPLHSKRNAPLNSISTTGVDSRQDLQTPYIDEPVRRNSGFQAAVNGRPASPSVQTPTSPYSPGMRSNSAAIHRTLSTENNPFDNVTQGEIQMQSFQEGLPPPPPVAHSWKRIDRWAENHYEELYDQLSEGATNNDLNELEHELDCSLPMEVRESLQIHDGQERGGRPTGIVFSCMLLDCEEISQEWQNWRTVNAEYLVEPAAQRPQPPSKAFSGAASSSSSSSTTQTNNSHWRQDLQTQQDSQPPNAIQRVYAHPNWIPLARDWGGNNIAVDLAPGPAGKWGQVILFGRDYDCKYVIARSWSSFLAMVADDLSGEKWYVEEDSGDLMLKEFKTNNVEPGYLDILRWRADQKYGRKGPRRKPGAPLTVNPNVRSKNLDLLEEYLLSDSEVLNLDSEGRVPCLRSRKKHRPVFPAELSRSNRFPRVNSSKSQRPGPAARKNQQQQLTMAWKP
jgi:cell wall assembly regulator SMI1